MNKNINVHLITGSKGGVGKTSVSTSIIASYVNRGEKVLVIEANSNNIDMTEIISEFTFTEIVERSNEHYYNSLYHYTQIFDNQGSYLMIRQNPYDILDSINEFLEMIDEGKKFARMHGINDIIIDTNLSFENLIAEKYLSVNDYVDEKDYNRYLKNIKRFFNRLNDEDESIRKDTEAFIWCIWSNNDFERIRSSVLDQNLKNAMHRFEEFSKLDNEARDKSFRQEKNFIHLINTLGEAKASKRIKPYFRNRNIVGYLGKRAVNGIRIQDLFTLFRSYQQEVIYEREIIQANFPYMDDIVEMGLEGSKGLQYSIMKNINIIYLDSRKNKRLITNQLRKTREAIVTKNRNAFFINRLVNTDELFCYKEIDEKLWR